MSDLAIGFLVVVGSLVFIAVYALIGEHYEIQKFKKRQKMEEEQE